MFRLRSLLWVTILGLSACAASTDQPYGAPAPTHPDMIFVDKDGCSWWVIGNATSYSWAKHTNAKGQHVCSSTPDEPDVPFVTETSETPAQALPEAPSSFIQVATFGNPENASATVARFKDLGLPVQPSSSTPDDQGFFRLVLGPFSTREATQSALGKAVTQGFRDAFAYAR